MSGQDKEWMEKAQREMEESILRDQEEARRRMKHNKDTASFQKMQIKTHLDAARLEQQEDTTEGEELQRLALQHQLEKQRLMEIRKVEGKQLLTDNLRQIDDVHRMQEIQKQQEAVCIVCYVSNL